MKRSDVLPFVSRDWSRLARLKEEAWLAARQRGGPVESLRLADALRRQVRVWRPDWPDANERRRDLEAHIALAARMRRVDGSDGD